MKCFSLQYSGYSLEVEITRVVEPVHERNFDLTVRGPIELPDDLLDGLLDYLHKEGFFDQADPHHAARA
jgi:hypothetical protein